jgi:hypothetical protein
MGSTLPVEYASVVEVKVACIIEEYAACHSLAKRVPKAIDAREVIKDYRAADDSPLPHYFERGSSRAIVVSVKEGYDQILFFQPNARFNDVASNYLDISALQIVPYGSEIV